MTTVPSRAAFAVLLLVSIGWANEWADPSGNRADEVDDYLATCDRAAFPPAAVAREPLHAMFWGNDPKRFSAEGGVWWGKLHGPVAFSSGNEIDVADVFGFDDRNAIPFVRLGVRIWRFELFVEAWWMGQSGSRVVEQEFEINGEVFQVGDVIKSRLTLSSYRLGVGFEAWRSDPITVTALINATLIYTTGSVQTDTLDKRAHWDGWLPVPAIGANLAGKPWKNLIYEFEVNWVGFSKGIFTVVSWDLRASVGWQFNHWSYGRVGYRFLTIEGDLDDAVDVDLYIEGFFLEFAVTF